MSGIRSFVLHGLSQIFRSPLPEDYAMADEVKHFYGIDFLRGLAAVVTLIWHYQHFYMITPLAHGAPPADMVLPRSGEPFYVFLKPIYEHGFWAIQGFWIISGFVFSHVYAGRDSKAKGFMIARFARLYPLHLLTLIFIAIAELLSQKVSGGFFVTSFNDLYHFFLHVFFVSGWGFQLGNSYNEPVWSVSVELAVYGLFFLLARRIFMFGPLIPGLLVGLGYAIANQGTPLWYFGICTLFFFLGVLVYYTLIRLWHKERLLFIGCAASLGLFAYNVVTGKAETAPFTNIEGNLFVPIVLLAGLLDLRRSFRRIMQPLRWLGDATYSMYLWHFPIQVAILAFCFKMKIGAGLFNHPVVWFAWIIGMIVWAHLSFRFYEKPMQSWSKSVLQRALAQPARVAATAAVPQTCSGQEGAGAAPQPAPTTP